MRGAHEAVGHVVGDVVELLRARAVGRRHGHGLGLGRVQRPVALLAHGADDGRRRRARGWEGALVHVEPEERRAALARVRVEDVRVQVCADGVVGGRAGRLVGRVVRRVV